MAMAVETLIPVEEYLRTSYSPDVEYVDGALVERNVGDWLHSLVQRNIIIERLLEFAAIGTPHIWVIDPRLELTRAEIFQE